MQSDNILHIPIYVDMDGTLVKTDIAQELLLQGLKSWSQLTRLCRLAFSGRSHIKHFLAQNNYFSAGALPYNTEVLDYLKAEKEKGRKIILATASDELIAQRLVEELNFFDAVIASSPGKNLKGKRKLEAIQEQVGEGEFEYIGDSGADYPIWQAATRSGFVNPPKPALLIETEPEKVSLNVVNRPSIFRSLLKAMRVHQWAKNSLIFVPLLFSHSYSDPQLVFLAVITFIVFSLCASGIYLINDLLDIEADRAHERKKERPFAAGDLLPTAGVMASTVLIMLAFSSSIVFLGVKTSLVIGIYFVLTNLYSFYLKHYSTIDVITLTCLYTLRIIAGGVAISISLSPWLLNFSLFFFLSLAYMKRYIELSINKKLGKSNSRRYEVGEMDVIMTTGLVNGGLAALTLTLYLNSPFVIDSYASPQVLWLVCPLLMFWIYRAWMWAKREKIHDDPVVFALKDRISLLTVGLAGALIIVSKFIDVGAILQ